MKITPEHASPTITPVRSISCRFTTPVTAIRIIRAEPLGSANARATANIVGMTSRTGSMPEATPKVMSTGARMAPSGTLFINCVIQKASRISAARTPKKGKPSSDGATRLANQELAPVFSSASPSVRPAPMTKKTPQFTPFRSLQSTIFSTESTATAPMAITALLNRVAGSLSRCSI